MEAENGRRGVKSEGWERREEKGLKDKRGERREYLLMGEEGKGNGIYERMEGWGG